MLFESDEARILAISFQRLPFLASLMWKSTDYFYWNRSIFSSQQILVKYYYNYLMFVLMSECTYICTCVEHGTHVESQSTTCGTLYPLSALWVLGMELGSSSLAVSTFTL